MIEAIEGILEAKTDHYVLIKSGSLTYRVDTPASTLNRLGQPGDKVRLYTHLQFKEDSPVLYGFDSIEARELFRRLISISGLGAKTALALLSFLSPEQLILAISSEDIELLSKIPGIGRKTASRLVLELKGKLELPAAPGMGDDTLVISALTNLGYSLAEATRALESLPRDRKLSLEEKIRLALESLAR